MPKKILLITTGGTIVSVPGKEGLTPAAMPDLARMAGNGLDCRIDTVEPFRLDSSNIQPEEWQTLAEVIHTRFAEYDGIVITHGTDTLSYTACMLSYMLQGIPVPVVLTGSQLPLRHPLTDAHSNLQTALSMAMSGYGGVYVAFDRKVMRGTRTVKARTRSFNAFESINCPPVATADARGLVLAEAPDLKTEYKYNPGLCGEVLLLKLVPGTPPQALEALAGMGCKGLVIEAFGAGGIHVVRRNLASQLRSMVDKGISIVAVSQCLYEPSDFSLYEVGREALLAGIIEGRDMTSEAAVTKLMWALANTNNAAEVRLVFDTCLAGEVSL